MLSRYHVLSGISPLFSLPSLSEAKAKTEELAKTPDARWLSVWDSEAAVGQVEMWSFERGRWTACAYKPAWACA